MLFARSRTFTRFKMFARRERRRPACWLVALLFRAGGLRAQFPTRRLQQMNRRNYLALMGAAAGAVAAGAKLDLVSGQEQRPVDPGVPTTSTVEDRTRRMKWWHEAKFGMFIHWGLYSTLGRHEWVM